MHPKIIIRNETDADVSAITEVTVAAFETLEISNHTEQFIIGALRVAKALAISLVAEINGRVIGHIAFSPVTISDGTQNWYGLGPVSVLPAYQRKGIGKALIQEGFSRLKDINAQGCCLVGHPDYYRKFGFKNMPGFVHEGVPQEVFLALSFDGHHPQGTVAFHEGFKADGQQESAGNALQRAAATYPACPSIVRTIQIGGETKPELLVRLAQNGVEINEAGRVLFASDKFVTSEVRTQLRTVELTVRNLGFPQGATISEVYASAMRLGLQLCPVELGPHLRLQFLDQPEGFLGQPVWQHRAPPGSIAIASEILSEDDEFPKGFYLRRIKGTLWLRGYWSGLEHICAPEDHFVFVSREVR